MTISPHPATRTRRPHWSLARTWFLQPGIPEGRPSFEVALASSADVVVLDVEDGLPGAQKPAGRLAVAEWLHAGGQGWVRINSVSTPEWSTDLDCLSDAPGLIGVMLAKAESADEVVSTAARLPVGTPVVALVESAVGIESAADIARSRGCARIAFGIGDFRRDTGMSADPMVLAYARARLVIASRAAGLPAPIDGPTLRDQASHLANDTAVTRSAGMTARLCLDLGHADSINRLLSPSPEEIDEARSTLARLRSPNTPYDGSVGPARASAEATLDHAARLGLLD